MLADRPSLTALGVSLARARLDRPSVATGDAGADQAMAASLLADAPEEMRLRAEAAEHGPTVEGGAEGELWQVFGSWVVARTSFFDEAVLQAIADGRNQVLLLGAGYDMRAHRFRTPGVRFLEVDHPATQADKRRRLDLLGLGHDDVGFVAADFIEPGLDALLDAGGHRPDQPTLFVLEGVLRYLPEVAFRGLLATLARRAAPGSDLAVSISCRPTDESGDQAEVRRTREHRLAESGEPVLTMPPRQVALRWLEEAGWTADSVLDVADLMPDARPGRLLVRAHP